MGKIHIGAVSYINTKPLVHGLKTCADYDLIFDLPSSLAERLRTGELDVGLIPIVEYLRGVGDAIVPGMCIASNGPVRTVKLYSRVHPKELQSVAVDSASRTSVALLRVLLSERFGVTPDFHTFRADLKEMLKVHEGALLIGDAAFTDSGAPFIWDLGEGWQDLTGLPFVYAAWVIRDGVDVDKVKHMLQNAIVDGLSSIGSIVENANIQGDQDAQSLESYLRDTLHYDLGDKEMRGIESFQSFCRNYNVISEQRSLKLATSEDLQKVMHELK